MDPIYKVGFEEGYEQAIKHMIEYRNENDLVNEKAITRAMFTVCSENLHQRLARIKCTLGT